MVESFDNSFDCLIKSRNNSIKSSVPIADMESDINVLIVDDDEFNLISLEFLLLKT